MNELAPFPLLQEALQSLSQFGTINTEDVFEQGLRYLVEGMRQSLLGRQQQ